MSFGADVTAKLGIDTSSVPQDLAAAKGAMGKFASEAETIGGHAGSGAGDKLVHGLEHKILGARHLSGALATALGLNIENLAEHVTAALVGGTKEAWKQMGELADENAKLIEKRIELAMTPKQLQDKIKKDAAKAGADLQEGTFSAHDEGLKASVDGMIPGASKLLELVGAVSSEAEKKVELGKKELTSNEAEVRLAESVKAEKESHKKLDEYREAQASKHLNSTQKLAALEHEIDETLKRIGSGTLSVLEVDEQRKRLIDLQGEVQDENDARLQREIDKKEELLRLQESYVEAQRKLAEDEEALANKRADRGKETIDEIANLKASKKPETHVAERVDTFGLSAEAAAAKEQAVELQRQQKEAERLRLSGDVAGANALFDQVSAGKQKLVDSGFAKSTEGDDFKKMAEVIHKDNMEIHKILAQIATVAQGKLKNQ